MSHRRLTQAVQGDSSFLRSFSYFFPIRARLTPARTRQFLPLDGTLVPVGVRPCGGIGAFCVGGFWKRRTPHTEGVPLIPCSVAAQRAEPCVCASSRIKNFRAMPEPLQPV